MQLNELQRIMDETYGERDRARGLEGTFLWLVEEVGELAAALRQRDHEARLDEFADCLAWLLSVANVAGVEMEQAASRYAKGCPYCAQSPCKCPPGNKP